MLHFFDFIPFEEDIFPEERIHIDPVKPDPKNRGKIRRSLFRLFIKLCSTDRGNQIIRDYYLFIGNFDEYIIKLKSLITQRVYLDNNRSYKNRHFKQGCP